MYTEGLHLQTKTEMEVTIRPIEAEELQTITDIFNEEDWNVSIKAVRALYHFQPEAIFVAVTTDGKIVGMFKLILLSFNTCNCQIT